MVNFKHRQYSHECVIVQVEVAQVNFILNVCQHLVNDVSWARLFRIVDSHECFVPLALIHLYLLLALELVFGRNAARGVILVKMAFLLEHLLLG